MLSDGVFIGPYDLSLSLGLPPPSPRPHPEAEKAIQRILQVARTAGKKWYVDSKSFDSLFAASQDAETRIYCNKGFFSWVGVSDSNGMLGEMECVL